MPVRVALLTEESDYPCEILRTALQQSLREVCNIALAPHMFLSDSSDPQPSPVTCRSLAQLRAARPDLIVVRDFGRFTYLALAYSQIRRRTRLLLWITKPKRIGLIARLALQRVDGVLAQMPASPAIARLGPKTVVFPVPPPADASAFGQGQLVRAKADAHRLVYIGDLTPEAGVADFLRSAASWAELNSARLLEIWWIGAGDLRGVLEAQPLPVNLSQRFLGQLCPGEVISVIAHCGILVVPTVHEGHRQPISEAMAAGLPVVGSLRDRTIRQMVREGETGWLFDPYQSDGLLHALALALAAPPCALDKMRLAAFAAISALNPRRVPERSSGAPVTTVLGDVLIADSTAVTAP